jgi:3-deoxy-D-manno-octulosonic-acid transferase
MLLLYNLLSTIMLFFYLPVLFIKSRSGSKGRYIKERLGMDSYQRADIWIHSVSLGETMAILPFLKRLKTEFPDKKIVLSTTTHTGQRLAIKRFPEAKRIMYMPWDSGICMKRVIDSIRPALFITIETELWPVLFSTLKGTGARIIILNGRISTDSFKGYRRIRPFMKRVLANVDHIYMQTPSDAERILALGAEDRKVRIMGNLKFDIEMDDRGLPQWSMGLGGRIILLAGSTHKGEEEIILNAYRSIKDRFNDILLILAPRHPERFDEVERLLKQKGLNYIRRTALEKVSHGKIQHDVILLDTVGELSRLYSIAAVTFIGGSLIPYGGHNILEPAFWGKPIIFGPHMDNFPFAEDFLNESAAIMVRGANDLTEAVIELLERPERAERMGERARAIIEKNKGATDKAIELIRGTIGTA